MVVYADNLKLLGWSRVMSPAYIDNYGIAHVDHDTCQKPGIYRHLKKRSVLILFAQYTKN